MSLLSDPLPMKSIRVNILGRDYALRVRDEAEDQTRDLARFVEKRMRQFKEAHPEQAELTTAVITALTLAEELHDLHKEHADAQQTLNAELDALAERLADTLSGNRGEGSESASPAHAKHDST